MLDFIAEVDLVPQIILEEEQTHGVFLALLRRPRCVIGMMLKDDLSLGQVLAQGLTSSEEDQCRVRQSAVYQQSRTG